MSQRKSPYFSAPLAYCVKIFLEKIGKLPDLKIMRDLYRRRKRHTSLASTFCFAFRAR